MAKGNTGDIVGFGTPWEGYSGDSVERFIKGNLQSSFRDVLFEPNNNNRMCFFASAEDKEEYEQTHNENLILKKFFLAVAGKTYVVKLTNIRNSASLNVTTNETSTLVGATYICQEKDFSATEWTDTQVAASVRVFVDAGATGSFDEITSAQSRVLFGETFQFDVRRYLINGRNQVRIQFIAENDESTVGTLTYTIALSEMYIDSLNLDWFTAFIQGSDYRLGGFKIVGSVSKTLKVRITDTDGNEYFTGEKYVGTSSYTTSPLYFLQSDSAEPMFPGMSGVYKVEAWLEAGTLRSNVLTYSIMCVAKADENNCKLIVVNEVAETAYNYDTNTLFKYAIYNNGLSQGTPHILLVGRNEASSAVTLYDEDFEGINCGVPNEYRKNIEWNLSGVSGNLALYFTASYGGHNEVNSIVLDNTGAYEAELASIQFYLNAANRSNAQSNRESIINEATHDEIPATWTRMAWIDGIDGWTKDDAGRSCLRIPAGSKVSIPYAVFGNGDNTAFDVAFKCVNVADYDENIITLASNPTSDAFHGVRIKPTNVTVHNNNNNSSDVDILQGTNFADEEVIHLFVSVARNYAGNTGKNLVSGYINGVINFHFEYTTGTDWANNVPVVIGSETADVFIYAMHSYSTGHGAEAAEKNYVNSMESRLDRIEMNRQMELLLDGSRNIDFDKVKNNRYNFFTVEMLNGDTIPSQAHGWSKDQVGHCNFEMHFGEHPEWDFAILDSSVSGQGTTSMDYDDWNLRWRIDKDNGKDSSGKDIKTRDIAYFNAPSVDNAGNRVYSMQAPTNTNKVKFDGNNHPAVKRITAKINWASSMQSHKIGATGAFNALHNEVFDGALLNEAQTLAQTAGTPLPVVAVYQYPAYGFAKTLRPGTSDIYDYEFIGLFTIGPDKGDKPSFGFDKVESELLALEGTDHTPVMATFHQKWDTSWGVQYSGTAEALGVTDGNQNFEKAWEVSAASDLDTKSDTAAIMTMLTSEWKPAYDCAYSNNTQIFEIPLNHPTYGASTAAGVLAKINADVINFRALRYDNRHTYGDMQFYIAGEYVLYDYYPAQSKYVAGVNLKTECGVSSSSDWRQTFIDFRKQRFRTQAPNYWHIQESLFNLVFCEVFGASDNFAKNSYPYKMKSRANGGRWRWRNDDLDTLGPIDNQGKQTKPYFILYDDTTGTTAYFNGSTSYFWNTLREAFEPEYMAMGKEVLESMMRLGTGGGASGSFNLILNFIRKYFWDKAQNYFLKSAYNVDDVNKYIQAWLSGKTFTVEPLTQALGDNYRAEFQWFVRRIIFMMARFKVGAFSQYTDTSLGSLAFRASVGDMTMKPAVALYPSIIFGANSSFRFADDRVMPGDSVTFNLTSSEDTMAYIPAVDWYTSLGDWKDFTVLGTNAKTVGVTGKRLREFKIGDTNPSVVSTNIQSISFSNTPSLETIQCSNIEGLQGDVDLTSCTRLREAYFGGTALSSVILPDGSKIESLVLPETVNALLFKNLKFIDNVILPNDLSGISRIQVENCNDVIDGFTLLKDIYDDSKAAGAIDGDNYRLYIRVSWNGVKEASSTESARLADMLGEIAENPSKFLGISPTGDLTNDRPLIEGTIKFNGALYTDSIDKVCNPGDSSTTDPETGLTTVVSSKFGTLSLIYNGSLVGIRFADPEVSRIAVANWDTNGDGLLTMNEITKVTNIGFVFEANTLIETFDEFRYFTGVTSFPDSTMANNSTATKSVFRGCTSLRSITLPSTMTSIRRGAFTGCTALESINLDNITEIQSAAFYSCTSLGDVSCPNLTTFPSGSWSVGPFENSGITKFSAPIMETMPGYASDSSNSQYNHGNFKSCTRLKEVYLPQCTYIGTKVFKDCNNLTDVTLDWENLTFIGAAAFTSCSSLEIDINVPKLTTLSSTATGTQYFDGAFYGTKIKSFNAPLLTIIHGGNATTASNSAFRGVTTLISVNIPSITTIGQCAFYGCSGLQTISTLNNCTAIQDMAFYGCSSLEIDLSLPALTSLGRAFMGSGITSISNLGQITTMTAGINTNAINNYGVFGGCSKLRRVTLPSTLTSVPQYSFYQCPKIEYLDMSHMSGSIGTYAFAGTATPFEFLNIENITSVALGAFNRYSNAAPWGGPKGDIVMNSLVSIGGSTGNYNGAFGYCKSMTAFVAPLLETINSGNYGLAKGCFEGCSALQTVIFGDRVTNLGNYNWYQCTSLETFIILTTTPPTAVNMFASAKADGKIYVPDASVDDYKAASGWSTYASRIFGISKCVFTQSALTYDGKIEDSENNLTTAYIPVPEGCSSIQWGVVGGGAGYLCEYDEKFKYVDYWRPQAGSRTVSINTSRTRYVRASFPLNTTGGFIKDATNNVYLFNQANL